MGSFPSLGGKSLTPGPEPASDRGFAAAHQASKASALASDWRKEAMEQINDWTPNATHKLTLGNFEAFCNPDNFPEVSAELVAQAGGGVPQVALLDDAHRKDEEEPPPPTKRETPVPPKENSTWTAQVVDVEAKARIDAQQKALRQAGVLGKGRELYAPGTRMADIGYANQEARKVEHDALSSFGDAAQALASRIEAEKREDVEIGSRELGRTITVNGFARAAGFRLTEQAIRGLLTRIDSPALRYVLGLRDRIAEEYNKPENERDFEGVAQDKVRLAETLSHECHRLSDTPLKLRARKVPGDIYAIVSPDYTPADAPSVVGQLLDHVPGNAKGSFGYDPKTTEWSLTAEVWTPTPVAEQAVGEPFKGHVVYRSRDNGTGGFSGGGGIVIVACLNASVYESATAKIRRVHRGKILFDIERMTREACKAIDALTAAWGVARSNELEIPAGVPISKVIPGFWRSLLTDRRSELVGVLAGRVENHVQGLSATYHAERRDRNRVVRADLAQGWTRYVQDPASVRSDQRAEAERAIGSWIVNAPKRVECVLPE